jgi:hypothetical protein
MANKIQIRRGLKANLPALDVGEPAFCTDTQEVFVGNAGGNVGLVNKETFESHAGNYILQIPYAAAAGSANTYTVNLTPALASYMEGTAVAVKINVNNTGASTININALGAKSIVDSKGNALTSGKLKANSIYTLRYNGTNFILQGEGGSGNATASDLLSGKTATVDAGEITGTLALTGDAAAENVLSGKKFYMDDPKTQLTGTMINKINSATVLTPSTTDQAIPQGYYGGIVTDGKVLGDADLVAGNIKSGVNIFGVAGSVVPVSSYPHGSQSYTTAGTYTFTVPANVTKLSWLVVGGGGGGGGAGSSNGGGGGGGSGGISIGTSSVTPGQQLSVVVGAGGAGGAMDTAGSAGGNSSFSNSTSTGGAGGNCGSPGGNGGTGGAGGTDDGGDGGNGTKGFSGSSFSLSGSPGGGGGSAGLGRGGVGGYYNSNNGMAFAGSAGKVIIYW